jgi:Tol biopolymer transport system component
MTSQRRHDDFDRLMTSWMDREAQVTEPEGLLDSALAEVARARRRPAWSLPERWITMQLTARLQPLPRLAPTLGLVALLIVAIAIALVAVGSQRRIPAPFGLAGNGVIGYDDGKTIQVATEDGTGVRTIVSTVPNATSPAFSRDGTQVAFWGDGGPDSLYVAEVDGSSVRVLLRGLWIAIDKPPAWAPDGRSIVLSTESGPDLSDERLVVVDVDTGATRTLLPRTDIRMLFPAWSPDGAWIVYVGLPKEPADPAGLWVVRPDGRDARHLPTTALGIDIGPPHWAPDPDHLRLAYSAAASSRESDIYTFDLAGDRESTVSSDTAYELWPAWSSDGAQLAWLSGGGPDVVRIALVTDPSATRDLPANGLAQPVAWSPDDRLIYGVDGSRKKLIVLTVDGSAPAVHLPHGTSVAMPDWQRVNP